MKSNFSSIVLILLGFTLMSSMCSSDDMDSGNDQQILAVENAAKTGSWIISSYIDSGQDETNHFSGYTFTFENNGTMTASNGTNTVQGTWSVTKSNDGSNGNIDFNIFFSVAASSNFEGLNDDWNITAYNNNTISLIDISGGNGGADTLIFAKN